MYDQWKFSENSNGSFRFTPPVHAIRSFYEALQETKDEGGLNARFLRYQENQRVLVEGMQKLGFKVLDLMGYQGPVITTFHSPKCPNYDFEKFYNLLKAKKFVIYPGKLTKADTFRIGSIGAIDKTDVLNLLTEVEHAIFWNQNADN
jgi:2-aminoethylphosphonate-pyruvate transaminase